MMLLHGEEYLENYKPIQAGTKLSISEKILDVQDKGSGGAIIIENTVANADTKEVHAKLITTLFVRGLGGFGYKGTYKSPIPTVPKRAPDAVSEEKTDPN